mmetsp:Transcript_99210/g.319937  ORF Transcript_99210/g.319937 Transcript_99210/m.319937 type:complete len:214 (+) Transcript_99210:94-735(+)
MTVRSEPSAALTERSRCTPQTGTRPRSPSSKVKSGRTVRSLPSMMTCRIWPPMVPKIRSRVDEAVESGSQAAASITWPLSFGNGLAWLFWKFRYQLSPPLFVTSAWKPLGSSSNRPTSPQRSRPKSTGDASSSIGYQRTTSPLWKAARTLPLAAARPEMRLPPPPTAAPRCSRPTGRAVKIWLSPSPPASPPGFPGSNGRSMAAAKAHAGEGP